MKPNKFIQYLEKIGDKAAAELFDTKPRTVMSWRLRQDNRRPRREKAHLIVERTGGKVKLSDIYGD